MGKRYEQSSQKNKQVHLKHVKLSSDTFIMKVMIIKIFLPYQIDTHKKSMTMQSLVKLQGNSNFIHCWDNAKCCDPWEGEFGNI